MEQKSTTNLLHVLKSGSKEEIDKYQAEYLAAEFSRSADYSRRQSALMISVVDWHTLFLTAVS